MSKEQATLAIQQMIQIIDKNKGKPTFLVAQTIFKEIVADLLENERQIWMSLAYVKKPLKNSAH